MVTLRVLAGEPIYQLCGRRVVHVTFDMAGSCGTMESGTKRGTPVLWMGEPPAKDLLGEP